MASCRENVVGVGGAAGNRLALLIAPQLSATARAELQTLASTTGSLGDLHIHVTRPPSTPLDTVVPFAAGSNSTLFTMSVELESATEQVVITLTLDVDTTVYYAGSQTVAVKKGATVVAPSIVMSYVGPIAAVSVTPANASVRPGDTLRVTAAALDLVGNPIAGQAVTFASSDTSVATVGPTGLVTGLISGNVTITATSGGQSGTAAVSVQGQLLFSSVNAGGFHSCGLTGLGAVYCWGANAFGALGDGNTNPRIVPIPVAGGLVISKLSAAYDQTCGLTKIGAAYCWGYNGNGQLGDGTLTSRTAPVLVSGGLVFSSIAVSDFFTCGLTTSGAAYCWGDNSSSQLGDGTTTSHIVPAPVAGGIAFAQLAVGSGHACGLSVTGTAYCWGDNTYGQLGDGTTVNRATPTPVAGGVLFASVTPGFVHTCALTAAGVAYCWGDNSYGEPGNGTVGTAAQLTPAQVIGGVVFRSLATGPDAELTCGLSASGAALCWGGNGAGQIGDGTTTNRGAPTAVAGALAFASVSAVRAHVCGLVATGVAYCWGDNIDGALGDGTLTNRSVPTAVKSP